MRLPVRGAIPALALAYALAALAAPAAAQTPTELPLETWVTGILEEGGSPTYRLPADFTGWVEIVLESGDFDTFATWIVTRNGEPVDEIVNDDSAALSHSTDSRIRTEVVEAGEGIFRVSAFGGGGQGEYRLRATAVAGPRPAIPIAYGADVTGELGEMDWSDQLQQLYEFVGNEGDDVWIVLESEDFDAVLALSTTVPDEPGRGGEIAWDDDGFRGTDAGLRLALPETGTYQIAARSLSGTPGSYRLRLGVGSENVPEPLRGRGGPAFDPSRPLSYVLSRQELVPAADMPPELVMMPQELDWLVEDGGRLINRALGFDLPSPGAGLRRLQGEELVELRGDISRDLFGVDTPPTNFGFWAHGDFDGEGMLIVMALKADTPPDADAVVRFGELFLQIDGNGLPLRWMDIQWEESRSTVYRFAMERDSFGAMRCTAGQDRAPGGLIVCALGIGLGEVQAMEQLLSGLRVR
ncbi:MAG TPA: PPC domain-containing protein [Longimicrobiales bacterium]|nr:PPC domain-containing protein [Longimicrobiales bacterium]